MPSLLMIHEVVGPNNALGKIAQAEVEIALAAGYEVTVIAKLLAEELRPRVTWHPLYVPPRFFYLQWITARRFIKRALARALAAHGPFDIVHAHQPQAADLADVFNCQFLTRAAYERGCFASRRDVRSRVLRLQQHGVLHAEDRCYRRWNPRTHMVYCSELMQREFRRLYGRPALETIIVNPAPAGPRWSPERRRACRARFTGRASEGIVAGYIGGLDERKGYREILAALREAPDISLLFAGPFTRNFQHPDFAERLIPLGLVEDTASFYAACDVLLVPSRLDPCPLAVFEAAACGTPVIVTDGVGNADNVIANDAGLLWDGREPLAPLIRTIREQRERFQSGALRLADTVSLANYARQLLAVYDQVRGQKPAGPSSNEAHLESSRA